MNTAVNRAIVIWLYLWLCWCDEVVNTAEQSRPKDAIQGAHCIWKHRSSIVSVYWINLDTNKDRKNYMEAQLRKVGLQHRRVSAITPTSTEYIIDMLEQPCKRNTPKDIAVILSHLKAMHVAVFGEIGPAGTNLPTAAAASLDSSEYALILEDDVRFLYDIDFAGLVASAPPDFGILQLVTSNTEAIASLRAQYDRGEDGSTGNSSGNGSRLWRRTEWNHFTRNGKTSLYWSAQAYLVQKRVVRAFLEDVVAVDPASGRLRFRIVNSFFPDRCARTRQRPCVLSNCLFADSYIFAGGGPTYVSTLPLFTGARVGLASTLHQDQVGAHQAAFSLIRTVTADLRSNGSAALPSYLRHPVCEAPLQRSSSV